jgi:transcriptional regulator with XRE-family HTH domain
MDGNIVCTVQTCQEFATRKTTFSKKYVAIGPMMDPPEIVAARLKALRGELGFKTQTAFADKLGIDKSTYNLYETAKRPLTFETACLIRREFGISIDWLFFGDLQQGAIRIMAKIGRGTEVPKKKSKSPLTVSAEAAAEYAALARRRR